MCVYAVCSRAKQMKKCSESRYTEGELQLNSGQKRKLYRLHENEYLSNLELPATAVSPAAFETSDRSQYAESTADGNMNSITRDLEKVDGQSEGFGSVDGFRSKVATTRLVSMDSSSAPTEKSVYRRLKIPATAAKMSPPPGELEEFLAEAEKYVQERFAEKYNYDIVRDVPLEGRYQWVRLHP